MVAALSTGYAIQRKTQGKCDFNTFFFLFFLQLSENLQREALHVKGENITWTTPVTLEQLLQAKKLYPDAKLVAGNTAVGTLIRSV